MQWRMRGTQQIKESQIVSEMVDFDKDNYKPHELPLAEGVITGTKPLLDRIHSARTLEQKLGAATQLVSAARKSITADRSGVKKHILFTAVAERFYDIGGFFSPSENDKLNSKAARFFFTSFKVDFMDYAFDRTGNLPDFNNKIITRFVVALEKIANGDRELKLDPDPLFRTALIKRIDTLLKTKKGNIDKSVNLATRILPFILARELVPTLKALSSDKTVGEDARAFYGAALRLLEKELAKSKPGAKAKPIPN